MSNQFFPTLHTSSWKMSRAPQWQTSVKTAVSGDRKRAPLQEHPRWRWTLKSGVLQSAANDLQAIQNLYTAMYGRLDWFLWKDPEGETIADPTQQINYLGNYYWPVAFTEDSMDFDRFAFQLWECGTCEFEQVDVPLLQRPNGFATSAQIAVTTTHIPGSTYDGNAWFAQGIQAGTLLPGGEPHYVLYRSAGSWTLQTTTLDIDVSALNRDTLSTLAFEFGIAGSLLGSTTSPDRFLIYDVAINATYEDGTIGALRPSLATVIVDNQGTVVDAANAIDGDPGTASIIERTLFGPGSFGAPLLQVSDFS